MVSYKRAVSILLSLLYFINNTVFCYAVCSTRKEYNTTSISSKVNTVDLWYFADYRLARPYSFDDVIEKKYMSSNGYLVDSPSNSTIHIMDPNILAMIVPPLKRITTLPTCIIKDGNTVVDCIYASNDYNIEISLYDYAYTDIYINWWGLELAVPYFDYIILGYPEGYFALESKQVDYLFHQVNKPFDFKNKIAVFVGDSITAGYTSGTTKTDYSFPFLFSKKVGLCFSNVAVAGSCFTYGYTSAKTIMDQIQSISGNPDYIFIAGGINDWLLGVPIEQCKNAIEEICIWINEKHPNAEIIWITPINEAGWEYSHGISLSITLDDFRRFITHTIVSQNTNGHYSIVQGCLFGFPVYGDDSDYIDLMFGDLLHPTELGYKTLYTTGLLSALC